MDTKGSKTNVEHEPQAERKHPPEWERDLNPNYMAGQNIGERSGEFEQGIPTAYDVKDAHRLLHERFADDELQRIPILPEGQRLEQGACYVDLRSERPEEFTAMGGMAADPGHWFVPKAEVPYSLWNRLIGVENPERIAERREIGRDR
ncbi:MAG TPA: hypothetical protein VFL93_16045 [Longimicrobiaceae bacterium]|jgi:hypothetical protein|nr:hypothetical protein [Longimicrobiaceae bacterium]